MEIEIMARMFARHPVSDFASWYEGYKNAADFREKNGVTAGKVYQNADDPNDVTVVHDFATADEAKAFVGNEELKKIMMEIGVAGPPTIWITEEA